MFQFSGFAFLTEYHDFIVMGCPIRKSPDQRLFAPTRSLSQLTTSFIASESQGIHHTLLLTFLLNSMLNINTGLTMYFLSFQYVKELDPPIYHRQTCGELRNRTIHLPVFTGRSSIELIQLIFKNCIFQIIGKVENNGFEPLTLCVQGRCSSQLS